MIVLRRDCERGVVEGEIGVVEGEIGVVEGERGVVPLILWLDP